VAAKKTEDDILTVTGLIAKLRKMPAASKTPLSIIARTRTYSKEKIEAVCGVSA
jgi:hypothetical protein